nr:MAG TPA: hypothetical protein [Caudoviricetes sp.]
MEESNFLHRGLTNKRMGQNKQGNLVINCMF